VNLTGANLLDTVCTDGGRCLPGSIGTCQWFGVAHLDATV
jgi:hypothetical protein